MDRRYTFKLYPTPTQDSALRQHADMLADLWNAMLQLAGDCYRRDRGGMGGGTNRPTLSGYWFSKELTALYAAEPAWRALSTWCGRRQAEKLKRAFEAFYRKMRELSVPSTYERQATEFRRRKGRKPTRYELAGYPRFKRRDDAPHSIPHRFASGCDLTGDRRNWRLTLKGVPGRIRARGELPETPTKWTDADVRFRDGHWEVSVAVDLPRERAHGTTDLTVRFDLLDRFVKVERPNGRYVSLDANQTLAGRIASATRLEAEADVIKEAATAGTVSKRQRSLKQRRAFVKAAKRRAKAARIRREALHVWSSEVVGKAASLTVVAPVIREHTAATRGNVSEPGAAVAGAAILNRHVLSQAPAATMAMLAYKAEEAGLQHVAVIDGQPEIRLAKSLATATKSNRRASRALKRQGE